MTELKRFQAAAAYGTTYTIVKRKTTSRNSWFSQTRSIDYVLSDGRSVIPDGGDMYMIVDNGEMLRKVG